VLTSLTLNCLDWEENATLELPLQVFTTSEFPGENIIVRTVTNLNENVFIVSNFRM
jgi:hypothetical protein